MGGIFFRIYREGSGPHSLKLARFAEGAGASKQAARHTTSASAQAPPPPRPRGSADARDAPPPLRRCRHALHAKLDIRRGMAPQHAHVPRRAPGMFSGGPVIAEAGSMKQGRQQWQAAFERLRLIGASQKAPGLGSPLRKRACCAARFQRTPTPPTLLLTEQVHEPPPCITCLCRRYMHQSIIKYYNYAPPPQNVSMH